MDGVVRASGQTEAAGQVFTLTGDRAAESREFFGHYARMLGKERVPVAPTPVVVAIAAVVARATAMRGGASEVTPAAVRYLTRTGTYSIEKARSLLGYEPAVDLDAGMGRSEKWLRSEGLLPQPDAWEDGAR